MSQVPPERWARWLGEMPMPEGATEEMMWAAFDAVQQMERQEEAITGIAFFTEFLEKNEKRLWEAEQFGDTEACETLKSIIKTTKEIIETYRNRL